MKVLVINTEKLEPQIVETPGGLDEWYKLIGCSLIDIVYRQIGGRYYDIILDDEGIRPGAKVTGLDSELEPQLVGNLVICNYDGEGGEAGLTEEDIEHIKRHIVVCVEDKKYHSINNTEKVKRLAKILQEAGIETPYTRKPTRWLAITDIEP